MCVVLVNVDNDDDAAMWLPLLLYFFLLFATFWSIDVFHYFRILVKKFVGLTWTSDTGTIVCRCSKATNFEILFFFNNNMRAQLNNHEIILVSRNVVRHCLRGGSRDKERYARRALLLTDGVFCLTANFALPRLTGCGGMRFVI